VVSGQGARVVAAVVGARHGWASRWHGRRLERALHEDAAGAQPAERGLEQALGATLRTRLSARGAAWPGGCALGWGRGQVSERREKRGAVRERESGRERREGERVGGGGGWGKNSQGRAAHKARVR
jgi:hypothetical protein